MRIKIYSRLFYFAVLCNIVLVSAKLNGGRIIERIAQVRNLIAELRSENGRIIFPRSIKGNIDIIGKRTMPFLGSLVENVRLPIVEELTPRHRARRQLMQLKDTAFYIGSGGSFACKAKTNWLGRRRCDIVGLLHDGDENCYLTGHGRAFCSKIIPGEDMILDPQTNKPVIRLKMPEGLDIMPDGRNKRQVTMPLDTANVISVAVYLDRTFMNRFKEINNRNYEAAIADVEQYIVLVGNEWTYRYQTIKQYPGWPDGFDLAVNIVEIVYPPENEDLPFMMYADDGTIHVDTIVNFYNDSSVAALLADGIVHHAMCIIGSVFNYNLIGFAYSETICNSTYPNSAWRVSMSRDFDYNLAHTGAHEIAHALGAYHDGDTYYPLTNCANNTHLMGPRYGGIKEATKDTFYTFSECTSNQFQAYLSKVGNCLHSMTTDFLDKFCLGPRGVYTSLNDQCEESYGVGWATCDTAKLTASEVECWNMSVIPCCLNGDMSVNNSRMLQLVQDGTPCDGPDPTNHHYCYLGTCTEGDTICGNSITMTPAPPTTPATTTPAPTGACHCAYDLCRQWHCVRGNQNCCQAWRDDVIHGKSNLDL